MIPQVHPVAVHPSPDLLAWAQRIADDHFAGMGERYDDDAQLSTAVAGLCAARDAVARHIDELDGEALGKLVYGWVLRSDGHRIHTDATPGLLLSAGDLYIIDPLTPHWTTCPTPGSQLIFAVDVRPPEIRSHVEVAQGFRDDLEAAMRATGAREAQRQEDEAFMYRGIEQVAGGGRRGARMTHPAPNSELTSESVNLLKAGDVLRHKTQGVVTFSCFGDGDDLICTIDAVTSWTDDFLAFTFVGRPDHEGWIPHDGGPNPVPGCVVDVRFADDVVQDRIESGFWDMGTESWWKHEAADKTCDIIAFRLAAPSVERAEGHGSSLRDTHRATDGLSGKLDRLQGASERMAEARAKLTPHTSSWPQMDRATNDFHNALNALDHDDCLKLIEAARAPQVGMSEANEPKPDVAGARERLGKASKATATATIWPFDLRLILSAYDRQGEDNERLRDACDTAHTALVGCSEYLDPLIDADGDSEGFYPNKEMVLQQEADRAIEAIERRLAARARQGGPDHG